ncbi:hypothetical protein [Priestia megaterium]|jgi:hypothetical protein|uniref:hypothetical protein n=1 Tax=Priestia megaterium TaxID=1404 RepID=UPI001C44106A|nr:hypothetical protein [Priestia megaterium]MBV6738641.1 hypothetical protein [Priestia megaterium]
MKKIVIVSLFLLIFSGCSSKEVVLKVDKENITREQLNDYMNKKYHDIAVEDLTNAELLKAKAKEKNLKFEYKGKEINPVDKDFLFKSKPIVEEILKDYIDDKKLKKYFKDNPNKFTSKTVKADIIHIDHTLAVDFMKLYNEGHSVGEVMSLLDIKKNAKEKISIDRKDERYEQLVNLESGELTMLMDGSKHSIAIVNKVTNSTNISWPKDKDIILETYISNNLGDEYLRLLGELKKEYKVTKQPE